MTSPCFGSVLGEALRFLFGGPAACLPEDHGDGGYWEVTTTFIRVGTDEDALPALLGRSGVSFAIVQGELPASSGHKGGAGPLKSSEDMLPEPRARDCAKEHTSVSESRLPTLLGVHGVEEDGPPAGSGRRLAARAVATKKEQFSGSRRHDQGSPVDSEGSWCESGSASGKRHGYGTYVHTDGTTYEGQWANGAKSGLGTERWSDGTRYEGEHRGGMKHGWGIYQDAAGAEYAGEFRGDVMHCEGRYTYPDGKKYFGQWEAGRMNGEGTLEMPDGSRYEGGWKAGRKSGEGTLTWPNGQILRGQWVDGKQHGPGTRQDAKGRCMTEDWHFGRLVSSSAQACAPPSSFASARCRPRFWPVEQ